MSFQLKQNSKSHNIEYNIHNFEFNSLVGIEVESNHYWQTIYNDEL